MKVSMVVQAPDRESGALQRLYSSTAIVMTSSAEPPSASAGSNRHDAWQQPLSSDTSSQVSQPVGHWAGLETAVSPRGPWRCALPPPEGQGPDSPSGSPPAAAASFLPSAHDAPADNADICISQHHSRKLSEVLPFLPLQTYGDNTSIGQNERTLYVSSLSQTLTSARGSCQVCCIGQSSKVFSVNCRGMLALRGLQ